MEKEIKMVQFIIQITSINGETFWLNQNMWSSNKASATKYSTKEAADQMAVYFLKNEKNLKSFTIVNT